MLHPFVKTRMKPRKMYNVFDKGADKDQVKSHRNAPLLAIHYGRGTRRVGLKLSLGEHQKPCRCATAKFEDR